jgi:hypothetical protein
VTADLGIRSHFHAADRAYIWITAASVAAFVAFRGTASFCAAAARCGPGSEPQHAAKSPADIVHDGCGRVADRILEVGLIEGDQGGDVDD